MLLASMLFVFCKMTQLIGHLKKDKSGRFAKTIFYLLRAEPSNMCVVVVNEKIWEIAKA